MCTSACVCSEVKSDNEWETYTQLCSLIIGIGYMTFGEKLDTCTESRKDLLEFQNAAIKLIRSIFALVFGSPLYKVFPTKAYRDFVYGLNYTLKYGMYSFMRLLCTVESAEIVNMVEIEVTRWLEALNTP